MITGAKKRALSYLEQNPLLHMGMIEPLRRGQGKLFYAEDDGVLLFEKKSGAYMISASSPGVGERLAGVIPQAGLITVHQEFLVPFLTRKFGLKNKHDSLQAVYFGKDSLPLPDKFEFSVLRGGHVRTVLNYYRTMDDEQYIRNRIRSRQMFGAFIDGKLAGFIGVHSEGSMGFLEVLPEYRRRGVGSALESYLIDLQLRKGWTPFCQIFPENAPSLGLQRKLGLEVSKERLYWLF